MATDPRLSLHRRIRADVEGKIMTGQLKPGDRIPFEHELMERFACSRMTVSKALTELANAGLIERRRRAGSFVAPQRIDMSALTIPDIRAEIERRGSLYRFELLERRIAKKTNKDVIDAPAGTKLLWLLCRHLADDRPFVIEHRLINLAAVPEARDVDFGQVAPGNWLLDNVPWTEARNRINAQLAGVDAKRLDCDPGAPCLGLERQTWRAGKAITYVRQLFSAAGFSLVAQFTSPGTN